MKSPQVCSRRAWLAGAGASAAHLLCPRLVQGYSLPTAPVAIAKCPSYEAEYLQPALSAMFDQLGGLGRLVANKTVAIKINLTGAVNTLLGDSPLELAQWTHPYVIAATISMMANAGARRIRILEGCYSTVEPMESFLLRAGWRPSFFSSCAPNVEFENTNGLGNGTDYVRVYSALGGYVFPAYDLNHSYADCDVFVSIAKMKEHATCGVTLSMKNCFGNTPLTIYGDSVAADKPTTTVSGIRGNVMHNGTRKPPSSAPQEVNPASPRHPAYRMPRIVTEIVSARPIDLAIIDGIETMSGGEGPWVAGSKRVSPGVLVAGTNPVTTDAVAMGVMGFDPMAASGKTPFEMCDNYLHFAEELGLGTRDLRNIEVVGASIADARFDFRPKAKA